MSANEAQIWAVLGASGSGKSLYVKTALLKPAHRRRRLMVWDTMREYGPVTADTVDTVPGLVEHLKKARFSVRYLPPFEKAARSYAFELFCRAAYAAEDCTVVIEEASFVTSPSWAPPAWSMVTCTGRHKGLTVIATSQRPAQVDKALLGNCSSIHVGRLNDVNDVRVMARALAVPEAEIRDLPALAWIERDMATGRVTRGSVRPPNVELTGADRRPG